MQSLVPVFMFIILFSLIFLGFPVAFSLLLTSLAFGYLVFGDLAGLQLFRIINGILANYVLVAVPLFVFMGAVLERTKVAERLFDAIQMWLMPLPGGVAVASLLMCALFAAATGVVGAVEVLVGMMAIPAMLRLRYPNDLVAGTICAGGSLGTMIPPSIAIIIFALVGRVPIGDLFAAAILPSAVMVTLFIAYVLIRSWLSPEMKVDRSASVPSMKTRFYVLLTSIFPILGLVVVVIGSIILGIASPTEASGVGAAGALIIAAAYRRLSWACFYDSVSETVKITSMVLLVVAGGSVFTSVFLASGGQQMVGHAITFLGDNPYIILFAYLLVMFIGGFFLDWISVVLIAVPIFGPYALAAGFDPVWVGMLVLITIQTSYLTPPMAPSIFYLKAISPKEMTTNQMYKGVMPFIICQILTLVAVFVWPDLAVYLPEILKALR